MTMFFETFIRIQTQIDGRSSMAFLTITVALCIILKELDLPMENLQLLGGYLKLAILIIFFSFESKNIKLKLFAL